MFEQVNAEAKLNGQTMGAEEFFLGRIRGAFNYWIQSKAVHQGPQCITFSWGAMEIFFFQ